MIYVIIQFASIFFLIYYAEASAFNTLSWVLILLSVVIGLKAVFDMKISNLNILPELKKEHNLVKSGIYSLIRHPMYTAVMLFCLALALSRFDAISLGVFAILCIDLYFKSKKEESYLLDRFQSYQEYRSKTSRFLPFL
ncbi:MAG: isoprenylcysteine carboxylmethyltransferase family protein [Gammaproteobacteria bacterium]|jgi:protein-S-isoprenylcysteine O-methyltransferase Ste14